MTETIGAVIGLLQVGLLTAIFHRLGSHSARIDALEKRSQFSLLKG